MGLWRDVKISIYYMSNGLTFKTVHIIFQNFYGYWDSVQIKFHENRLIDGEINEKHSKLVRAYIRAKPYALFNISVIAI